MMEGHEVVALAILEKLVEMRRNQPRISADDIRVDCSTAHAYAESFMKMVPPPPPPEPRGF